MRHTTKRGGPTIGLFALSEDNIEQRGNFYGVIAKNFIKVAHAKKKHGILAAIFEIKILAEHRCHAGFLVSR